MIRIRGRVAGDVGLCVGVLAEVHRASGYPANWPGDLAGWITPAGSGAGAAGPGHAVGGGQ